MQKIIITDIDGTIPKSDLRGSHYNWTRRPQLTDHNERRPCPCQIRCIRSFTDSLFVRPERWLAHSRIQQRSRNRTLVQDEA